MDAVAHQHAPAAAAGLVGIEAMVMVVLRIVAFVVVAVAVQLGLFEQEEKQQAQQQGCEERLRWRPALEGFGQDQQQGRAEQQAGGQTDQALEQAAEHMHRERCGDQDRGQAAGECGYDDIKEGHQATCVLRTAVFALGTARRFTRRRSL